MEIRSESIRINSGNSMYCARWLPTTRLEEVNTRVLYLSSLSEQVNGYNSRNSDDSICQIEVSHQIEPGRRRTHEIHDAAGSIGLTLQCFKGQPHKSSAKPLSSHGRIQGHLLHSLIELHILSCHSACFYTANRALL